MSMIASVVAALITPASVETGALLKGYGALNTEESAAVVIDALVRPDGRLVSCKEVAAVGERRLAKQICPMMTKMRWRPATDSSGKAVYGRVRDLYRFFTPDDRSGLKIAALQQKPDIEITVNRLPVKSRAEVRLRLAVSLDENAQVIGCEAVEKKRAFAALVPLACAEAGKVALEPITSEDGTRTSFVTVLTAELRTITARAQEKPDPLNE